MRRQHSGSNVLDHAFNEPESNSYDERRIEPGMWFSPAPFMSKYRIELIGFMSKGQFNLLAELEHFLLDLACLRDGPIEKRSSSKENPNC